MDIGDPITYWVLPDMTDPRVDGNAEHDDFSEIQTSQDNYSGRNLELAQQLIANRAISQPLSLRGDLSGGQQVIGQPFHYLDEQHTINLLFPSAESYDLEAGCLSVSLGFPASVCFPFICSNKSLNSDDILLPLSYSSSSIVATQ